MRVSRAALVASGAVLGGASFAVYHGSVSKSSQLFGPSIYRGSGNRRSVALTFDDGPSESTDALLEVLDREGVPATFFMCGVNVRRLPEVAGRVAGAGHEIGNHTDSHPLLALKSRDVIDREFTRAQRTIAAETGVTPMLLRPPYGARWIGMREVQCKLSLLGVLWTVSGYDWKWPADRIAQHVVKNASPGAIVCLHDGRDVQVRPDISRTINAVRELIPALKDQGYTFETVSSLISE